MKFTRAQVKNGVIQQLWPLAVKGGLLPAPYSDYRIEIAHSVGDALFSIWRMSYPITTCGVAWTQSGAVELWGVIEELYYSLSDRYLNLMAAEHAPVQPDELPWLGVVFLPAFPLATDGRLFWLGDFHRCLAWTILLVRQAWCSGGQDGLNLPSHLSTGFAP